MEIKLLQKFDFNDKNSLFCHMDNMNDAIIKDIRESDNSLFIILHKFDDFLSPSGEAMYPYKELEIEYKYAKKDCLEICVHRDKNYIVTPSELLDWLKKEKAEIEMSDWMITSGELLYLKLFAHPKDTRRKLQITDIDIHLIPQQIIYSWKS